jgi:hypothetical protein
MIKLAAKAPDTSNDPPENIARAVGDACSSRAWQDINRARIEQITKYGHTPAVDDVQPMHELASRAWGKLASAKEDLTLGGWDYFAAARRRLVTAAAMIIAQIDRIDRKLAEREDRKDLP